MPTVSIVVYKKSRGFVILAAFLHTVSKVLLWPKRRQRPRRLAAAPGEAFCFGKQASSLLYIDLLGIQPFNLNELRKR